MQIGLITSYLESIAPLAYQESYDNSGLLTGNAGMECTGILCTLDATVEIVREAKARGCNLIVAHHPILFKGITRLTGKNYVEQALIEAIKNDIAIYAIHTNLDNVANGVNAVIAEKLGLINTRILLPKNNDLVKLVSFAPLKEREQLLNALFQAGAGQIGEYSETSFSTAGTGTFKGSEQTNPYVGTPGIRHEEPETRIEVILQAYLKQPVLSALLAAHPYEEVAYDFIPLLNANQQVGSGLIGELPEPVEEMAFLQQIQTAFGLKLIKHTPVLGQKVQKVALCGGAGSFLISTAKAAGASFFISSDIKYHEFFDAENRMVIADIGHWESEQYTIDLLFSLLNTKFPNFAVLKTAINTNPVRYFIG
ncbi:MAG: Nif3-like dinuclear metal center hexameric protein [Sediminibacterium sp.]|nr:Nif3-like dinuclear metal center hexameric protein [Sediminibacterium sp.]